MDDQDLKTTIEEFLANIKPGDKLEIPHVGQLEYQAGRRLTYFKYRTGEPRVWELPDPNELSIIGIIQDYLARMVR
jgi:hypothetical protein